MSKLIKILIFILFAVVVIGNAQKVEAREIINQRIIYSDLDEANKFIGQDRCNGYASRNRVWPWEPKECHSLKREEQGDKERCDYSSQVEDTLCQAPQAQQPQTQPAQPETRAESGGHAFQDPNIRAGVVLAAGIVGCGVLTVVSGGFALAPCAWGLTGGILGVFGGAAVLDRIVEAPPASQQVQQTQSESKNDAGHYYHTPRDVGGRTTAESCWGFVWQPGFQADGTLPSDTQCYRVQMLPRGPGGIFGQSCEVNTDLKVGPDSNKCIEATAAQDKSLKLYERLFATSNFCGQNNDCNLELQACFDKFKMGSTNYYNGRGTDECLSVRDKYCQNPNDCPQAAAPGTAPAGEEKPEFSNFETTFDGDNVTFGFNYSGPDTAEWQIVVYPQPGAKFASSVFDIGSDTHKQNLKEALQNGSFFKQYTLTQLRKDLGVVECNKTFEWGVVIYYGQPQQSVPSEHQSLIVKCDSAGNFTGTTTSITPPDGPDRSSGGRPVVALPSVLEMVIDKLDTPEVEEKPEKEYVAGEEVSMTAFLYREVDEERIYNLTGDALAAARCVPTDTDLVYKIDGKVIENATKKACQPFIFNLPTEEGTHTLTAIFPKDEGYLKANEDTVTFQIVSSDGQGLLQEIGNFVRDVYEGVQNIVPALPDLGEETPTEEESQEEPVIQKERIKVNRVIIGDKEYAPDQLDEALDINLLDYGLNMGEAGTATIPVILEYSNGERDYLGFEYNYNPPQEEVPQIEKPEESQPEEKPSQEQPEEEPQFEPICRPPYTQCGGTAGLEDYDETDTIRVTPCELEDGRIDYQKENLGDLGECP